MILVIDVGNTNITYGVYEKENEGNLPGNDEAAPDVR